MVNKPVPTEMSFFERFEHDIVTGMKTITIRDEAESHYVPGSRVNVVTFEEGRQFCKLDIKSVEPILLNELSEFHAEQENMTLPQLREVIEEIYPGLQQLFVVSFTLVKN
ncbi:N(4)-acetylcytidine aminohydrolase [Photobacterium sp. SDRW27]|uniref:N(4)-acetylcytidine aminohydrolase n=1 Tax=Photobacterium obscurum TaxID=2829490 RepID=UPI002244AEA4|nr:N(4)-acetylcytidine aminohydrolase [Photobacterium obscurum]MCW8329790.1 N(4)-acetylcytidine aminohydrolase [Photobacterium obscurum]